MQSGNLHEAGAKEIELRASVHLALEELEPVAQAFHLTVAPRQHHRLAPGRRCPVGSAVALGPGRRTRWITTKRLNFIFDADVASFFASVSKEKWSTLWSTASAAFR